MPFFETIEFQASNANPRKRYPSIFNVLAIPALFRGRDVVACARTGSGKTLSFVLPMIRHVKTKTPKAGPIALIVSPTRELCNHIVQSIKKFAENQILTVVACHGGSDPILLDKALKKGIDVVVGTPAKILERLDLNSVTYLIVDEADHMFEFGYDAQIKKIEEQTHPSKQFAFFCASFSKQVQQGADQMLNNPLKIIID